eukprot:GFYU01000766.1.p1 GENE.GFYU01000766.1~~GFYU01000766.1.p1  ORF type:complete len:247 (-),score=53.06 GFYU01000766.1:351-1091(-)
MGECQLGGAFGTIVQFVLGILSFSCLYYKRARERPQRPFGIWARDAGKQGLGSLALHVCNMALAEKLGDDLGDASDPCVWYLINFLVDTALGVFVSYLLIKSINWVILRYRVETLYSGDYGDPPSFFRWMAQTLLWVTVIIIMKTFTSGCFMIPLRGPLNDMGVWLLSPVDPYPDAELLLVMVFFPLILNGIQFWLQDNFLMDHQLTELDLSDDSYSGHLFEMAEDFSGTVVQVPSKSNQLRAPLL